jgi:multiple sugar transport system permease protein
MASGTAETGKGKGIDAAADGLGRWVDRHISWFFVLPAVFFLAAVLAFPIVYTAGLSLFRWSGAAATPPVWVGLRNFADVFAGDPGFWNAIWVTAYFTGVSLLIEVSLGWARPLLNRVRQRNRPDPVDPPRRRHPRGGGPHLAPHV